RSIEKTLSPERSSKRCASRSPVLPTWFRLPGPTRLNPKRGEEMDYVRLSDFGGMPAAADVFGPGTDCFDNTPALNAALAHCKANGVGLYVGKGAFWLKSAPYAIDFPLRLWGYGKLATGLFATTPRRRAGVACFIWRDLAAAIRSSRISRSSPVSAA